MYSIKSEGQFVKKLELFEEIRYFLLICLSSHKGSVQLVYRKTCELDIKKPTLLLSTAQMLNGIVIKQLKTSY